MGYTTPWRNPGTTRSHRPGKTGRQIETSARTAAINRVEIVYCTQCRWLLRAAWMAQELLTTFEEEIAELALKPGSGGIFEVRANGQLIWSRRTEGRFPEIVELKRLVRDRIAPGRSLGHADRKADDTG